MNRTRDQLAAANTQALQHLADLTHDFDAVVAASRDTNARSDVPALGIFALAG